jgi:glucose-1-phosphate adenylyltransferase
MEAVAFGVMHVDKNMRITDFLEKPKNPPSIPGDPDHALASMGIYIFNWAFLRDLLIKDAEDPESSHDFGNDIIPDIVKNGKAVAHRFADSCVKSGLESEPYWRDVGTIDAFWQANIDLTDFVPKLDLYDNAWPIWTYAEIVPPAKFIHDTDKRRGMAVSSLISGDCIVSGSEVRNSLLFTGCRTHSFATLDYVVALPQVIVGRKAELSKCVIDRGVIIPEGLVVGQDADDDEKWFRRTESGIVLITQDMLDARAKALS